MNDPAELRAEALQFLWPPRDLAADFLVVLVAIMVTACVAAVLGVRAFDRALIRAQLNYAASQASVEQDPRSWLSLHANPDAVVGWLDAVPSVLVTVGIFGTFVGLGIALHETNLDPKASTAQIQNALVKLVNLIAFKFQVSSWAILLSVIFTVFVRVPVEAWVEGRLARVAAVLSSKRVSQRDTVAAGVAAAFDRLQAALVENVGQMTDAANTLGRQATTLGEQVGELKTGVSDSAKALADGARGLKGIGDTIAGSLSGIQKELAKTTHDSNEAFKQTQLTLERLLEESKDYQNLLSGVLKDFNTTLNEFVGKYGEFLKFATKMRSEIAKENMARAAAGARTAEAPSRPAGPNDGIL
jgi:hypothetical protein